MLRLTLVRQCWGFMVGSLLFALGSVPALSQWWGPEASNVVYFVGAWFFTGAALIQLGLSGAPTVTERGTVLVRAVWAASAIQLLGTFLFNISTTDALATHTPVGERVLVWAPSADGSVAFLVSSLVGLVALRHDGILWSPGSRDCVGTWLNLLGSIAFGVSAVASIVTPEGDATRPALAAAGTFVGAVFFFAAAAVLLVPRRVSAPA